MIVFRRFGPTIEAPEEDPEAAMGEPVEHGATREPGVDAAAAAASAATGRAEDVVATGALSSSSASTKSWRLLLARATVLCIA